MPRYDLSSIYGYVSAPKDGRENTTLEECVPVSIETNEPDSVSILIEWPAGERIGHTADITLTRGEIDVLCAALKAAQRDVWE